MHLNAPYSSLLSKLKEEAKKKCRETSKKRKVVLEELARKCGFANYDTLQKLALAELVPESCNATGSTAPFRQSSVISDIAPPIPNYKSALCRSPNEFLTSRSRFGNPTYAVTIHDDKDSRLNNVWFFSDDIQEAVAIGLRWHERDCAIEQFSEEDDGEIFYGYRVRNLTHSRALQELLYEGFLWRNIGADLNELVTTEILTCLRQELFIFLASGCGDTGIFTMLDFSRPDGEVGFMEDWENEL